MANETSEPTLGEVVRRLDRMENLFRELASRKVESELYQRDRREDERRFTEFERDLIAESAARTAALDELRRACEKAIADEAKAREDGDVALAARMDSGGANWRQAVYNGLLPTLCVLITLAVSIWLAKGK